MLIIKKWCDELDRGDFAAHFYANRLEQIKVALDLLKWMKDDAKFVYFIDKWPIEIPGHPGKGTNAVLEAAIQGGYLEIVEGVALENKKAFIRSSLISSIGRTIEQAINEGFKDILIVSENSWLHSQEADFNRHLLESLQLTLMKLPSNVTVMDQYDRGLFERDQIEKIESIHQISLSNGILHRKYWVVSPRQWEMESPIASSIPSISEDLHGRAN